MTSGINPNCLCPAKRLDEIAEILAAALMRLPARKSSSISADSAESSLDCASRQSGLDKPTTRKDGPA
jgi:hypothetical protein